MDQIDLDMLAFMKDRDQYYSYKDIINKGLCTKESWTLIGDFGRYFAAYPEVQSINDGDFELWLRVQGHPGWKPEEHQIYGTIIRNVQARTAPVRDTFLDQLEHLRFGQELSRAKREMESGAWGPEDVLSSLTGIRDASVQTGSTASPLTLDDLALNQRSDDGLYFRCEDLNQAIGPIRRGDFVVIAKRPEVGGTSFLTSEMSYMVEQLDTDASAVIFNNEEAPDKVFTRMLSGALGVDYRTMMNAPKLYQQQWEQWLGGRQWDLNHNTSMSLSGIHRHLRDTRPSLIGINVLAKVDGTSKKEDHDKLEALGQEMRRISQEYGPVLAVVQADPSAEGMRYIPQDRIYKSKTGLQGEADVLIMIGHDDNGPPDSRYIHVAKNKIPPAPCCDLAVKHIKSEVQFDIGTGRFGSRNYQGNSRCTK